ncbi:MAG: glycoside hydrolase family 127 protein [Eubacteriales bacterium]|nr:glycoside hydrolase family 127 protein [Eubacteriales bacterium]
MKQKAKTALPILEAMRADAVRPEGVLATQLQMLSEMAQSVKDNVALQQRASLLQSKWLLEDDVQNIYIAPCDFLENPAQCLKTLELNLLLAKRYRNKDILMQLIDFTESIEEKITEPQRIELIDAYGVDILRFLLDVFQLYAKPSLLTCIQTVKDALYPYAGFLQNLPVIQESTPEPPQDVEASESVKKYYAKMHCLAHGENIAKAVESAALSFRCSGLMKDVDATIRATKLLEKYHGTVHGAYTACDHLAGRCPSRAIHIKAATSYFNALQKLLCITQDVSIANRMENIAINLLFAYAQENGLQVMQSTNQIEVGVQNKKWYYAQEQSNAFFAPAEKQEELLALCDSMNLLKNSLWMQKQGGGLVLMFPFASKALYYHEGKPVQIVCSGNYPYEDTVELIVHCKEAVKFPIYVRIPDWASQAVVSYGKDVWQPAIADSFFVISKTYHNGDVIKVRLPMAVKIKPFYRRSLALFKGPVLYALPAQEATGNFALTNKPNIIEQGVTELQVTAYPYTGEDKEDTRIALMPNCDVQNPQNLRFVPYHTCRTHIAQFATVDLDGEEQA